MNDLTILMVSCDKYSDLWPIFIKLFEANWKDCPWPLVIGSNHIKYDGQYKTILIGDDSSWCDNVQKMLAEVESEYVLLLLEDFFLDRKVKTGTIKDCLNWMKNNSCACLRLKPAPPPSETINYRLGIGRLHKELPYYVSTQPAIWRKETLIQLLHPGYSAWEFEQLNSKNAGDEYGEFAGTNKAIIHHRNGVERGKFYSSVVKFLRRNGIDISGINREITDDEKLGDILATLMYKMKDWIRAKLLYRWMIKRRQ